MSRDGSGNYSRVEGPYINGVVADADEVNAELDDIASALSDSINNAGTKAFAADQSMGGNQLTDVGTPSNGTDAANKTYVDSAIVAASQPLDATLTALAALSWSSGSPLVQFTAADTVSLTLAPSVSSLAVSQGAANTTASATFTNSTDNALVRVARFAGNRSTAGASGDQAYITFDLDNAASSQIEFARLSWRVITATAGAEDGLLRFSLMKVGAVTTVLDLFQTYLSPTTSDTLSLGNTTQMWSDLFLASGGVANWNNGNFTLTHVSGGLEASGFIEARVPLSSETTGTLTAASANRKVACSGNITLDDGVFTADDFTLFDPGASARTFTRASGLTMYVNGTDSASATLAANQMGTAHWRSSTVVVLSGAFT